MKQHILSYLNGDNSFAKYFARWYVAVLRLEIIGRIGNFSMPSRSESLWILAVSQSFPADKLVGYIRLYSLIKSFDLILRKAFCTFLSVVFVGSWFSFWNYSVSSSSIHFSWYLSLFMMTMPLPLSAFRTAMSSRFLSSFMIFLYL